MARRVAAVVLPQLACELVRLRRDVAGPAAPASPLAVIVDDEPSASMDLAGTAVLDVVDDEARRYGVRPGQKVSEAAALVAGLAVHRLDRAAIEAALGRAAEVAMALGTTAALRLGEGDPAEDTVWLDVTGAAHLVGGEAALLDELAERVGALGHRVRVAIADGPHLAQALARWKGRVIAPEGGGGEALADLPVHALAGASRRAGSGRRGEAARHAGSAAKPVIDAETASWLVRVGVFKVGDLARLPRAAVAARLGPAAGAVLELVAGRDGAPLVPFAPPRVVVEEVSFEEGVSGAESLLFILRGMASRAAARLAARGEATTEIEVRIPLDRSIARLRMGERGALAPDEADAPPPAAGFRVELPAPLAREADLLRAIKAKLERVELPAPAVGVVLTLPQIVRAPRVQLDLSRDVAVSPDALPALLAELSAEIGPERIGVLAVVDSHRPEARSRLVPVDPKAASSLPPASGAEHAGAWSSPQPTRMLASPEPVGHLGRGAVVAVDQHLYAVERARFVMRLDGIEWWTRSPVSRDYARVVLGKGGPGGGVAGEAWIYTERATGEAFLQGWCD